MNVLLWVLQGVLALLYFSGGAYKIVSFNELATMPATAALPQAGWAVLGVLEILGAILLIAPAAMNWKPWLTPLAAAVLAAESLTLTVVFSRYSLDIAATNPLVWTLSLGAIAAFVAYGRYALRPPTMKPAAVIHG